MLDESIDKNIKLYANNIYLNLINAFNPYKLRVQKKAFREGLENKENENLYNQIKLFRERIKVLADT